MILKNNSNIFFKLLVFAIKKYDGMYSFFQHMTIICRDITALTQDGFYTNLDHIMTAYVPTKGQIV